MSAGYRNTDQDYRACREAIPAALVTCDYTDGKLRAVYRNRRFYRMLGYEPESVPPELSGSGMGVLHPEDEAALTQELLAAARDGRDGEVRIRLRRADGDYGWFSVRASVEKDTPATPLRFGLVFHEITQLLESQQKAEEEEQILRDAMRHADMLYFAYYPDSRRYENLMIPDSLDRVTKGMADYPECVIRKCALSEADAEKYRAMVRQIDEGAAEAECTVAMRYVDSYRWMNVKLFNLETGRTGERYAAGFAADVTETVEASRRFREEVLAAEALRRDILGTVYVNVTQDTTDSAGSQENSGVRYAAGYEPWVLEEALRVDPRIAQQAEETRSLLLSAAQTIVDEDRRQEYIRRLSHFGLLDEEAAGRQEFTLEYRRRVGRKIRWVSTQTVFRRNPETDDLMAFFYLRDIDRRKSEEQAIHSVFEKSSDFIAIIDPETDLVTFLNASGAYAGIAAQGGGQNSRTKRESDEVTDSRTMRESDGAADSRTMHAAGGFTGSRSLRDLDGTKLHENYAQYIADPDERRAFETSTDIAAIREKLLQNDSHTLLYDFAESDGQTSRKQLSWYWLDDRRDRIVAVQTDLTEGYRQEQHRLEQLSEALCAAEAASRAKSDFLSRMSHDIRTPMNAIIGFSTLLLRDAGEPARVKDEAGKILSSGRHLLGLINDILDMSKIESGKMQITAHEFSFAQTLAAIDSIIRPQMESRHQTFDIYTSGLAHDLFFADENRLQQILINILSNATKYTQEGGTIRLYVTGSADRGEGAERFEKVTFAIADNGRGMTKEYQETIFEPFTREKLSAADKTQGTGLGLAITKNLIGLMGGTIAVESELGKGSTFTVELPMRIPACEEDASFWETHRVLRMLAVDDDEEVCANVARAMSETGVQLDLACSGADAVRMTQEAHEAGHDYDLVLLDWLMPDMDGLHTARELRRILPPEDLIIILTAYDYSRVESEAMGIGVDGFLMKPFFTSALRQTIAYVRGRNAAEALLTKTGGDGEDEAPLEGLRILAAEDNDLNAEILRELLEMRGASVQIVADGQQAVETFRALAPGSIDLILMDVQMPVMNGYEATRAIRALGREDGAVTGDAAPSAEAAASDGSAGTQSAGTVPVDEAKRREAAGIPIIAMTANAFSEDVKMALEAGMDAHIAKPLSIEVLTDTLTQVKRRHATDF